MTEKPYKICIFASFSGQGGVERMIVNLCRGLASRGCQLDLVLVKSQSVHIANLPKGVRVIKLKANHTLGSIFELARYLRRQRPSALLAAKERAGRAAIAARFLAGGKTRLVVRIGTTLSAALEGKSAWRKWAWYAPMRLIYPHIDGVAAVSQGVAEDLCRITGLPRERFRVIPNPVITPRLAEEAAEALDHPWFLEKKIPVVVGVGRLTRQKDFPTLIRAFARVRKERPCRLLILGDGQDKGKLEALISELGLKSEVRLEGFVSNPYKFLRKADLFVLSSAWEGSPNVLTEALALGVPVVATDCPSGPREILAGGTVAPLVPVGDEKSLAAAILETLTHPPEPKKLIEAAAPYNLENSSRQYLEILMGRNTVG
ncbi:MAG: glycosyltransferase [Geoalkalibacter sp.]|jgi:glycosyltransferase involved in cell wall biosynthesis|uniref:glycosyltransferase n=1 Tax=Geoalkalibacter sp. TaxID=3041440 RepID=UPI003D0E2C87